MLSGPYAKKAKIAASAARAPIETAFTPAVTPRQWCGNALDRFRILWPLPPLPPPKAQCEDGLDNDSDTLIDYPSDPGCTSATDNDETNTVPCNTATNSGGEGVTTTVHQLGQSSGTFAFTYQAYTVPDQFDVIYQGQVIYSTNQPVSGGATVPITYSGTSTEVTVVVTGPVGTAWDYVVNCPS